MLFYLIDIKNDISDAIKNILKELQIVFMIVFKERESI